MRRCNQKHRYPIRKTVIGSNINIESEYILTHFGSKSSWLFGLSTRSIGHVMLWLAGTATGLSVSLDNTNVLTEEPVNKKKSEGSYLHHEKRPINDERRTRIPTAPGSTTSSCFLCSSRGPKHHVTKASSGEAETPRITFKFDPKWVKFIHPYPYSPL